jgi:hypothetical protein
MVKRDQLVLESATMPDDQADMLEMFAKLKRQQEAIADMPDDPRELAAWLTEAARPALPRRLRDSQGPPARGGHEDPPRRQAARHARRLKRLRSDGGAEQQFEAVSVGHDGTAQ